MYRSAWALVTDCCEKFGVNRYQEGENNVYKKDRGESFIWERVRRMENICLNKVKFVLVG